MAATHMPEVSGGQVLLQGFGIKLPPLSQLEWQSLRPGVAIHVLHRDQGGDIRAALLRYESGAQVPAHWHDGLEYIFVLEGMQSDERGEYPAGTLVLNPPGSRHAIVSPGGCIVLIIWERPVRFETSGAESP